MNYELMKRYVALHKYWKTVWGPHSDNISGETEVIYDLGKLWWSMTDEERQYIIAGLDIEKIKPIDY